VAIATYQAVGLLVVDASVPARANAAYVAGASLVAGTHLIVNPHVVPILHPPGIPSGEHFGAAKVRPKHIYTGAGIVTTGGTAGVNVEWSLPLAVLYNISASFDLTLGIEYNIGHLPLYWFRVEGLCETPSQGCPTAPLDASGMKPILNQSGRPIDGQCPQMAVQVVPATTPDDVCRRVALTGFIWQITRMSKFSNPVNPFVGQQQQDAGLIDPNCNTLTDVPFCQTVNCKQFCLQTNARIGLGMAMRVIDTFFSYTGSGAVHLTGSGSGRIVPVMMARAFGHEAQGGFRVAGRAGVRASHYQYKPKGAGPVGILIGGAARIKASHWRYEGSGEMHLGGLGEAVSTRYQARAAGVLHLGGAALVRGKRRYASANFGSKRPRFTNLKLAGTAKAGSGPARKSRPKAAVPFVTYNINPTGIPSAEAFGTSRLTPRIAPPSFSGGNAFGHPSLGIPGQYATVWGGHGSVVSMEPVYHGTPAPPIPLVTAFVPNDCGCLGLPYKLQVSHDLDRAVPLTNFLVRNGLTLPNPVTLFFSNTSKSYLSNTHLRGQSGDGSKDLWMILFEWACTDFFGGLHIGSPLWRFSFLVTRRNAQTQQFFETRMIAGFPPATICADANMPGEGLNFGFKFNVNDMTFITKHKLRVDLSLLYDNLELFTSSDWAKNPYFAVNISALENPHQTPRMDISPIFPEAPTSTSNPIVLA